MADTGKLLGYFMRHGYTAMSPRPEGWSQIPLDARGRRIAEAGATALGQFIDSHGWHKPTHIVTSDLMRAKETAKIASQVLGITQFSADSDLRAFGGSHESPDQYNVRLTRAFRSIVAQAGTPLVVAHRSTSAWLDIKYGKHRESSNWTPDFVHFKLCQEGGSLAFTEHSLIPIFRCLVENFPQQPSSDPQL